MITMSDEVRQVVESRHLEHRIDAILQALPKLALPSVQYVEILGVKLVADGTDVNWKPYHLVNQTGVIEEEYDFDNRTSTGYGSFIAQSRTQPNVFSYVIPSRYNSELITFRVL